MHLYFQNVHEEHQMGLKWALIQFVKNVAHIASLHYKDVWFSWAKNTAPLHHKEDVYEDLKAFPSIGNNDEGHNKPP
jgi:hypothetical protein